MDISVNGTKMAGLNPWWAGSRAPAAPRPTASGCCRGERSPGAAQEPRCGQVLGLSLLSARCFYPAFIHSLQKKKRKKEILMSIQPLIWIPEIYFFLRFRQPGCELLCVRVWACRSKQPFMQCYTQGSQLFQGDLASAFVLSECIGKRQTKSHAAPMAHQETAQLQHRVPAEASLGSDRLHLKNSWSHLWLLLTQVYWLARAFTFLFPLLSPCPSFCCFPLRF